MKLLFKFFISLLLLTGCSVTLKQETSPLASQDNGTKVVLSEDGDYGLQYMLPNTGLRFNVLCEKVEKKRGEFYLYSERYLGLKEVILEDAVEWEIKSISLDTYPVPSEKKYRIDPSSKYVPQLRLSQDGVLLGVNDLSQPIAPTAKVSPADLPVSAVPYTEEMLLANSTAKMAEEAARYIYRLRESKTALLSSDLAVLPPDGMAYEKSLSEIELLEKKFISLFAGETTRTCVSKQIEIVPEALIKNDILFRFSSFSGVVDSDNLSGSPIFIKMTSEFQPSAIALPDTAGLFYCQPAKVNVTLVKGMDVMMNEKVMLGQLGVINALPPTFINEGCAVQMYPSTGAIKALLKE